MKGRAEQFFFKFYPVKYSGIIFVVLFSTFSYNTRAQQYDLWQWNTLSLEKKLSKKFTVSLEQEIRFYQNVSRLNLLYTNFGINYKVTGNLKTSLVYRYLLKKQDDGSYSFRHRFYVDFTFKKKIKIISLGYRARFQAQVRDVNSSDKGYIPETYMRNKVDVKLDFGKPFRPYIAAEFRYQFNNTQKRESDFLWNRGRYYAGFDFVLNKKNTIGAYYMLQWEYNVNDPERDSVIGLEYSLSL